MSQHKYSIDEIARLRMAIAEVIAADGGFASVDQISMAPVEDRLRTYMINGTTPEEMEAHAILARLAATERKAA